MPQNEEDLAFMMSGDVAGRTSGPCAAEVSSTGVTLPAALLCVAVRDTHRPLCFGLHVRPWIKVVLADTPKRDERGGECIATGQHEA